VHYRQAIRADGTVSGEKGKAGYDALSAVGVILKHYKS
jgi:hypothetical protein